MTCVSNGRCTTPPRSSTPPECSTRSRGKRTRRRRTHRLGAVAAVLAVLLVIGATAVLVARHDGSSPHVAVPPAGISARVVSGDRAVDATIGRVRAPRPVMLDAPTGTLRAPLYVGTATVSAASDDLDANGVPRSRVVRVDGSEVVDIVGLQGAGDLDHRGRGRALGAHPQPPGHGRHPARHVPQAHRTRSVIRSPTSCRSTPTRWARSRPSVARCGCRCATVSCSSTPTTVTSCGTSPLRPPPTGGWRCRQGCIRDRRWRAPPARPRDRGSPTASTSAPRSSGWRRRASTLACCCATSRSAPTERGSPPPSKPTPCTSSRRCPPGFHADGLESSATRMWATGTVDGAPAIVLLDDAGVHATVVLDNAPTGDVGLVRAAHRHRGRER